MKKLIALLLTLSLVISAVACAGAPAAEEVAAAAAAIEEAVPEAAAAVENALANVNLEQAAAFLSDLSTEAIADSIPDNVPSIDGKYEIAFVTDIGQLKDKSFNQGTWNGCKLAAASNLKTYKYYQPANGNEATDEDRYDAMKAAAEGGAKVVVCAGFLQAGALTRAAIDFPDVDFVFIDGWALTDDAGNALPNVVGIAFHEEQCGYFAGYAVVKEGFTKLGFCGGGGGTNPACCRYGYGFVQGANAAAAEMGTQVEINYSWQYGSTYSASPELQTMANGWYETGTEVIFACGGTMFNSITAAASANDGLVIGVDTDQSAQSDTVITSAMKGIGEAAQYAINKVYDGTFPEIGGTLVNLGAADDAVGIPTATWSLENYTVDEYMKVLNAVKTGELVVDADYEAGLNQAWSNVKLNLD